MKEDSLSKRQFEALSGEDQASALFANLVMQQMNMAFMMLGKVPHPETKETILEIESAKLIINQLEMLQTKTIGNLNTQEDGLLRQSLMTLRMAFVEAVEQKTGTPESVPENSGQSPTDSPSNSGSSPTPEEGPRKKFSKKY